MCKPGLIDPDTNFWFGLLPYLCALYLGITCTNAAASACDLVLSPDVNNSCHQFATDVIV